MQQIYLQDFCLQMQKKGNSYISLTEHSGQMCFTQSALCTLNLNYEVCVCARFFHSSSKALSLYLFIQHRLSHSVESVV